MNIIILVYVALLFFVLTPNIFVTLPDALDTTSKYTVAGVHAAIFAIVFYLTYSQIKENFGSGGLGTLIVKAITACPWGRPRKLDGTCP